MEIYHYLSKDQDERVCFWVIESIQNRSRGAGLLQYACVIARRQRDYAVPLAGALGPACSSLSTGKLRLVDHYIGRVPAGELWLIVRAAALLVCDTVGDDGLAAGRKRIHHRSDHSGSDCRCRCNRRASRNGVIAATSATVVVVVVPTTVDINVSVYVDVRVLVDVGVPVGIGVVGGVAVGGSIPCGTRLIDTAARSRTLVLAAAESFQRMGAKSVVVAEGPGHQRDSRLVLSQSGYQQCLRDEQIRFVNLNRDELVRTSLHADYTGMKELWLPRTVLEADFLVAENKDPSLDWRNS